MNGAGPDGGEGPRTWTGSTGDAQAEFTPPARWKLARPLGSGGQAEVWLAQDGEVGGWVAIKVFRPGLSETDRERLRREVRLGRSLQHAGLVRLYELIENQGRLALVMEWMPGGSLIRLLESAEVPIEQVIRVADQALDGLEYLHAQGVVHRDVKPSNLLLDDEGNVKLADLGLARPLEGGRDLTVTNMTVGTPGFMSPEQIQGAEVTSASDLYALGATLFQLITKGPVFEGSSHYEVARHHLESRPPDPRALRPDCPRWLARFVLRLLEKRPEDRWRDAGSARLALHRRAGLTSPRAVRNAAAVAGSAAVLTLAVAFVGRMAFETFFHPAAQRVEASGREVLGLGARGEPVWRVTFESPVRQVERVDLNGDGTVESVAVAVPQSFRRMDGPDGSEVAILDERGGVVSRLVPERAISFWPFAYPKRFSPEVRIEAAGARGLPMLLVNCRQRYFYPTVLELYRPRTRTWDPFLYHAGWLGDLATVPGSDPPRLRFEGVNNRLGMYPVVGEVVLGDEAPAGAGRGPAVSIADTASLPTTGPFRLAWYTLLDLQGQLLGSLELSRDGGTVVRSGLGARGVDGLGNPVPGPNAGIDIRASRNAYLGDLSVLTPGNQALTISGVRATLAKLRARHAALLRERPYRTVLEMLGARAVARAGGLKEATETLRSLRSESDAPEVTLRLAHLLGIAGDLEEAKELARNVLDGANSSRRYDAAQLLRHLSLETRDVEGVRRSAMALGYFEVSDSSATGITAALWGGAHMWWDELTDADTLGVSSAFAPAADAVACLARWRLGRTLPGDPEAMKVSEQRNPDALGPCRAARAAALIGLGHPREAAALLDAVAAHIESGGVDDFELMQGVGLARAIYAKALLAAGDRDQARRVALALQPRLRAGLLPRILVDEVLRDAVERVDGR